MMVIMLTAMTISVAVVPSIDEKESISYWISKDTGEHTA
jgi:hypothetical protein